MHSSLRVNIILTEFNWKRQNSNKQKSWCTVW